MRASDLDAVLRVQAACYPASMQEAGDIVLARLRAAPATCLVACDGVEVDDGDADADADAVLGYLFAYRSQLGMVTDLGAHFDPTPDGDTLYLHDLAIGPRGAGRGLARALVTDILALARSAGLRQAALVSVQDSARFWHGLGFRGEPTDAAGLATYPPGALYMVRKSA